MDLPIQAYLFGIISIFITLLGGKITLRFKKYLNSLIAFCGGSLVALSIIDLIPESIELTKEGNIGKVAMIVLASFLVSHFLDKLIFFHSHSHSEECHDHNHDYNPKGISSVLGLGIHSLLDGIIIGSGFLASHSTGVLVAFVVLMHRFSDGVNTITLSLRNSSNEKTSIKLLFLTSLFPLIGIFLSDFLNFSNYALGVILAIFAGFFLYLGATDLLPEAHKERSSIKLVFFTFLGALIVIGFGLVNH